jgi:hypothetical protein
MFGLEEAGFVEAQAGAINGHQEGAVLGLRTTDGEQTFQFPAAVNLGSMGLAADPGQESLQLIGGAMEHQVKEAAEGADGLVERTVRSAIPRNASSRMNCSRSGVIRLQLRPSRSPCQDLPSPP